MSGQWMYLDVAATRIQHYISRTPRLKGQRGASAWLSWATDAERLKDEVLGGERLAGYGVHINPEAGEADGRISVRFPVSADLDPRPVAEELAAHLRWVLPAIELDAVWGSGPSYLEAYRDHLKDRRVSPPFVSMPPCSEFPALASCAECRAGPVVATIDIHEERNVRVCGDCLARYEDRYRKPGLAVQLPPDKHGRAPKPGRPPIYREEAKLATSFGLNPVAGTVQDFTELAGLGSADTNRNHVATVYADGNAIGAFFDRIAAQGDPALKEVISAAVSEATRASLLEATKAALQPEPTGRLPVIPHIVGGDDLVVTVAADRAWRFAVAYLDEFRRRLSGIEGVPGEILKPVPPTASAGVVFAHAKFPFRRAMELAAERMRAAKRQFFGVEPAIAWLDVTHDGERPPEGQHPWKLDDLSGLSSALRALRQQVEPSGRATLGRLVDVSRPEVSLARVREHARRLEREAVLAPFLSQADPERQAECVAGALSLARWWR